MMTKTRTILRYALLSLAVILILFPALYAVSGSLMSMRELASRPPSFVPTALEWSNYRAVFESVPLARQYFNSILVAMCVVASQVVCAILSAYVFAFLDFPFRRTLFAIFLITMMVPAEAVLIPNYLFMAERGLLDSYWALTLPYLALGIGTFLLRQSFLQSPRELQDAAAIDGCGHVRYLVRVLLPLSKPALGALSIYVFITIFNQYFWPLLVSRTPEMQTIQIGVSQLQSVESNQQTVVLAGAVLAILPTLVILYLFQKSIVSGLTAGAVK